MRCVAAQVNCVASSVHRHGMRNALTEGKVRGPVGSGTPRGEGTGSRRGDGPDPREGGPTHAGGRWPVPGKEAGPREEARPVPGVGDGAAGNEVTSHGTADHRTGPRDASTRSTPRLPCGRHGGALRPASPSLQGHIRVRLGSHCTERADSTGCL